jgi:hypothetical protein
VTWRLAAITVSTGDAIARGDRGRALRVLVAIAAILGTTGPAAAAPPCPPGTPTEAVGGAWNGAWRTPHAHSGSAGAVLSVGERGDVMGQFTFVSGAMSRSARYHGSVCGGAVTFPLASGGQITLTLDGTRLLGRFRGPDTVLPAGEGTIEMTR